MPPGEGPGRGGSPGPGEAHSPGGDPGPEKVLQGAPLQISVLLCQNQLGERDKVEAHRWIFPSFCVFTFLKNLLIFYFYFWPHWVFVAVRGLSLVATSGGYSSLWCAGFSLQWLLLLWSTGSRCMGFSSCGSQAQ